MTSNTNKLDANLLQDATVPSDSDTLATINKDAMSKIDPPARQSSTTSHNNPSSSTNATSISSGVQLDPPIDEGTPELKILSADDIETSEDRVKKWLNGVEHRKQAEH